MKLSKNNPLWETAKFVARTAVLVGVPAVVAELATQKPEWGVWLGIVAMVFDKLIHEDKTTNIKGLLPF